MARMIRSALRSGHLQGGRRLLDSSSGNAGIAYAMLGAALGVPVTLVVPGNASRERLERIEAHGAELILTDPIEGYDFALREAQRLAREQPERYWHCDQYSNDENWKAHYEGTGAELLAQVSEAAGRPAGCLGGWRRHRRNDHRRWPPAARGQPRSSHSLRGAGAIPRHRGLESRWAPLATSFRPSSTRS